MRKILGKKWAAQRDRGRESALVLELNVTCQDYNHVCTALERTVLGDIFTAQKRKRKDLKVSLNLQKLKKDKENLLVAHSTSRGGRSSFMYSSLLKAILSRSSAQKRPLGFPFCLWQGKVTFQSAGKNALKSSVFKETLAISGFCISSCFSLFLSVVPQQPKNNHLLSCKLDRD